MFWCFNVFMNSFEQEWAVALKKGRQRAGKKNRTSLEVQKKQLAEELSHYRDKLKKVCRIKNHKLIGETTRTLIKLLAEQVGIRAQEMQIVGMPITEFQIKRLARAYANDCAKILKAVEILSR